MCGRCGPRRGLSLSRWSGSRDAGRGRHLGSAHTAAEVEVLKAVAAQRGQDELPLEVAAIQEPMALESPRRG